MSTKIYDGMKITPGPGRTLFDVAHDIRGVLETQIRQEAKEDAVAKMQKALTSADDKPEQYVDLCTRTVLAAEDDDDDDSDYSFMLFQPEHNQYALGIPFGNPKRLAKHLLDHPEIEEWSYWNNTDRPEDVSEAQWEQRKCDWDVIGYGPTADYGLTIQMSDFARKYSSRRLTFTSDDWEEVAHGVFLDTQTLAEKAARSALWKALFTGTKTHTAEAVKADPFHAVDTVNNGVTHLLADHPGAVVVPDYDPGKIRSSEPLEHIQVNLPLQVVHTVETTVLAACP